MSVNFEDFTYYPALRTRPAEMLGYQELAGDVKDNLLPLITLGAWPKQPGVASSLSSAKSALGDRPFILDLTREPPYQNNEVQELLSPTNTFKSWLTFVAANPLAIPVVQMTKATRLPDFIRQTRKLAELSQQRVAFRIVDLAADTTRVVSALSALDSAEQAIVILDLGLVTRDTMGAYIAASIGVINEIREDVPDATIAVIASSFPSSVTSYLDKDSGGTRGTIPILERELFEEIGSDACIYGDHSSIHPKVPITTGGKYTPRIDYPMAESWEFERRPDTDAQGYVSAAKALIRSYPEIKRNSCWGAQKVVSAAAGLIDKMKTPSSWIAARVNMHITRQLGLSQTSYTQPDDDLLDDWT